MNDTSDISSTSDTPIIVLVFVVGLVVGLAVGYGLCSYIIMSKVEKAVISAGEKLNNKLDILESKATAASDKIDRTVKKIDDTMAQLPFGK